MMKQNPLIMAHDSTRTLFYFLSPIFNQYTLPEDYLIQQMSHILNSEKFESFLSARC